jgi:hypothetical protein
MAGRSEGEQRGKKSSHVERANKRKHPRAEAALERRPSNARIFRVAAGLAEWTQKEREWMQQHPKDQQFEERLRAALKEREAADTTETFVERLHDDKPKGGPPTLG